MEKGINKKIVHEHSTINGRGEKWDENSVENVNAALGSYGIDFYCKIYSLG